VIDLKAYAHNLSVIRGMIPAGCRTMGIVKADAYGHGAVPIAMMAVSEGVGMLGVATVQEALELREAGITAPILVLFQPGEDTFSAAVAHDLRITLSSVAAAERIGDLARRANKVVPVHCKVDTGMGRQGFSLETAVDDLRRLTHISHIDIEGICTHFAVADVAGDPFTDLQIKRFKQLLRQIDKGGTPYEVVHCANSGAIVAHAAAAFDMVRPGIMAYGAWPMGPRPDPCPLQPVLRWETSVTLIKELPADWSIGYGRTYFTRAPMVTAVLPVGYRDGYQRRLSNRADVLIRGQRCPVRGRVSMDQIVVDVTNIPGVAVGDTAVLIGNDGGETITVEELAQRAETIPNEILTGIGPRVERVYVE
jgi:alanine racemase